MKERAGTITLQATAPLRLGQGCTLSELAHQLQPFTDRVLCVVNEVELRHYSAAEQGLRPLDTAERRGEYLFGDSRGNTYRVFGKSAARRLCPYSGDSPPAPEPAEASCTVIVDGDETFTFDYVAPRVRVVPLGDEN